MKQAVQQLSLSVGTAAACRALCVPRASWYRRQQPPASRIVWASPRALSETERGQVLSTLHSERFVDLAPREVYATLLEEGRYQCSVRTMYRLLHEATEVRERRDQLRHPAYAKPELLATAPNQLWSWDITKLLGPVKWTYYYLYTILDIFSRYVVGWMLALSESARLAECLIRESVEKQGIVRGQLTLHSDRGAPMRSTTLAQLLAHLGIDKSHSRPHVSNDNPYSESQFKTMKYCPEFPSRFGSPEDALSFCRYFFPWYNDEHHHSALGLLTPAQMHYGLAAVITARRAEVLRVAYAAHPERFVRGVPQPPEIPTAAWINKPLTGTALVVQEPRLETAPSGSGPQGARAPAGSPQGQRWSRPLREASASAAAGAWLVEASPSGPDPEGAVVGVGFGENDQAGQAGISPMLGGPEARGVH